MLIMCDLVRRDHDARPSDKELDRQLRNFGRHEPSSGMNGRYCLSLGGDLTDEEVKMYSRVRLFILMTVSLLPSYSQAATEPPEAIRPQWQVGDRWTVETATRQVQNAEPGKDRRTIVQWQFEVKSIEKLDGRNCFCIEAAPQNGPKSRLWIDCQSLGIRQVQAGIVIGGQTTYITESYATPGGQASPVFSPLPALPIDLPAFPSGKTKSLGAYHYEATPGVAGEKGVDDIGFAVTVDQEFTEMADPQVKSLATDPFIKDMKTKPTVGVQLKGPFGRVRQLWKPGVPWPVCSENRTTTSRLVEYKPVQSVKEPTQPIHKPAKPARKDEVKP